MRTSTSINPRIGRLAGAAAILFVPLATLLVALLARVDEATLAGIRTGALGVSVDARTAVRWVVAASLLAAVGVVAGTLVRRR